MFSQKFIETALYTSNLIIIWKQYEKLIIHAQGIFYQCAFPKDNCPKWHFSLSVDESKARQGKIRNVRSKVYWNSFIHFCSNYHLETIWEVDHSRSRHFFSMRIPKRQFPKMTFFLKCPWKQSKGRQDNKF